MADIFQEIDEELRKDKAQEWWRRYGKFAIAAAVVIIAAVAGYTWYEQERIAELQALAERYGQAQQQIDAGDLADAEAGLGALAADASDKGIGLIARFQSAGLKAEQGDHAAAASAFDEIAGDTSVDPLYRDLASVMGVLQAAMAGEGRSALRERIDPFTKDGQVWRFTARMIAASLAIADGDREAAEDFLKRVADDAAAPTSARGQAAEILQALGS